MSIATTLHSVADAAAVVSAEMSTDRRVVVGIAGAPGSGKSTLAGQLADLLGASAAVLPMDGFHLPQARLVELGRRERMGAPDTFDVDGFRATLIAIRRGFGTDGSVVSAPGFDRSAEEPVLGEIRITPAVSCVTIEGNYLLLDSGGWERTAALLDLSFYLDVEHDLRVDRLIARHRQFGKTAAAARAWALGPDEANARLIEGTAVRADYRISLP
jgi:pantothenate kinase